MMPLSVNGSHALFLVEYLNSKESGIDVVMGLMSAKASPGD